MNLFRAICRGARSFVLILMAIALPLSNVHADPASMSSATVLDTRFGADLGAGSQWQPAFPESAGHGISSFSGKRLLGCSNVDFNRFLQIYRPSELLSEIKGTLLNGAQAEVANFLMMMTYTNPSLASVLDMVDKRYSARFQAFSLGCQSQKMPSTSLNDTASALSEANEQCFDQAISSGLSPTEAYRKCMIDQNQDDPTVPAAASTTEFLKQYTSVAVDDRLEMLLGLLPDRRIRQGTIQVRPPTQTIGTLSGRLRQLTRAALDQLDSGKDPALLPDCSPTVLGNPVRNGDACLPASARVLIASPAFRSAQQLSPASRTVFKDALSSQIATQGIYGDILDLYEQISHIDSRPDKPVDAIHVTSRRQQLHAGVEQLLQQVDAQVRAQEARSRVVRSQLQALERLESQLQRRQKNTESASDADSLNPLVQLFLGHPGSH